MATLHTRIKQAQGIVWYLVGSLSIEAVRSPQYPYYLHRKGWWCGAAVGGKDVTVKLAELDGECDVCLPATAFEALTGTSGRFLTALLRLERAVISAERLDVIADSDTLRRRRDALTNARAKLDAVRSTVELAVPDSVRVAALIERAARLHEDINRNLTKGPGHVLRHIRQSVAGTDSPDVIVDDMTTLVGFHPYRPNCWDQKLPAIVEHFSLRADPLVLAVPRYVADWLARESTGASSGFRLPASAAGLSDTQLQTAARLWEPEGSGALSTLAGTVAAARLI